jgi:hypothetical protein
MYQPEQYRHIKAWGQCLASDASYIRHQQEIAAADLAPLDAIYKGDNGAWSTYSQVTNDSTRQKMNTVLAREPHAQ